MNDIADTLQKRKKRTHSHLCSEKGIAPIMIDINRINSTVDQQKKKLHEEKIRFRFDYGPVLSLLQEPY